MEQSTGEWIVKSKKRSRRTNNADSNPQVTEEECSQSQRNPISVYLYVASALTAASDQPKSKGLKVDPRRKLQLIRPSKPLAATVPKSSTRRPLADYIMAALKLCALEEVYGANLREQLNGIGLDDYYDDLRRKQPEFIQMQKDFKEKSNHITYEYLCEDYPGFTAITIIRDVFRHPEILRLDQVSHMNLISNNYLSIDRFKKVFIVPARKGFERIFNSHLADFINYNKSEFMLQYFVSCMHLLPVATRQSIDNSEVAVKWKLSVEQNLMDWGLQINYAVITGKFVKDSEHKVSHFIQLMGNFLVHPRMFHTIAGVRQSYVLQVAHEFPENLKLDNFKYFNKINYTYGPCKRLLKEEKL